ncbi:hypothetical protein IHE45_04G157500 [Dioscorea alata]|uniref:Uncharacterized protein n=1 Tax=Dioscorea alata TaxID=55571 RepID=A0ACB7WGM9_DIOAL|nr:hypothetical protein IHE45_04G157500 [Dioscorea alata]
MGICGLIADSFVVLPAGGGFRSPPADSKLPLSSSSLFPFESRSSLLSNKSCSMFGFARPGVRFESFQPRSVRVKAMEGSGESQTPVAPLQFESPTGQLLSQIMVTHPHLLPAAIDQQLERLQTDSEAQKRGSAPSPQDLLYRRIAEVKDKDRQRTLEEIIYCLIVQKFMDKDISMIPPISPALDPAVQVDSWPNQEKKLEAVHSPDALEMIESHLSLILGERVVGPLNTIVQISKLKLGKLYAASIMYGYFLKRVDERYQLERTMNTLPTGGKGQRILGDLKPNPLWDMESLVQMSPDEGSIEAIDPLNLEEGKSYRLRSYVMYLDAETLQRYATIRSKESISLIEKQTQALFGRPDVKILDDGSVDASKDEVIAITFSGLTMLVLEAVAFGSFLWDAESYVESKYHFFPN